MTGTEKIALAPDLPVAALADTFRAQGRVQVKGVLTPAAADAIHRCLKEEIPWQTAFRHGDRHIDLSREQVAFLDRTKQGLLADAIWAQARDRFAYAYNSYPVADTYARPGRKDWAVYRLYEMLNGPDFLDFAREVTGMAAIRRADAQATLFHAGHFLTDHDDDIRREHRLAAYVLNLTPSWKIDWGGLLAFHGADGNVEQAFTPAWNTLNIFRVPMHHSVTFVAPFCPAGRYSVTGWLRGA